MEFTSVCNICLMKWRSIWHHCCASHKVRYIIDLVCLLQELVTPASTCFFFLLPLVNDFCYSDVVIGSKVFPSLFPQVRGRRTRGWCSFMEAALAFLSSYLKAIHLGLHCRGIFLVPCVFIRNSCIGRPGAVLNLIPARP